MKTLLSQCLMKVDEKKSSSNCSDVVNQTLDFTRTHTDDCRESCDVSRLEIEMARTITEARENPDRLLCGNIL